MLDAAKRLELFAASAVRRSSLLRRGRDALRAAEAILLLGAATGLIRFCPRGTSGALVRALSAVPPGQSEPELESAVIGAVEVAERYVPRSSCLSRAVAACAMLRRRGVRARIRLGATRGPNRSIRAHAWLECGGTASSSAPLEEFVVLSRVA